MLKKRSGHRTNHVFILVLSLFIISTAALFCSYDVHGNQKSTSVRGVRYIVQDSGKYRLNLNLQYKYDEADKDAYRQVFQKASELLYIATDGQMQIGTVRVFDKNAPTYNMEVIIFGDKRGGSANVNGLGKRNQNIELSQTHKSMTGDTIGQFGVIHELGHYLFGLYDEYEYSDKRSAYCTSTDSTLACFMDGGTTVTPKNQRCKFCTAETVCDKTACSGQGEQNERHKTDCWSTMVKNCKERYGISLKIPDSAAQISTALPDGHQDITWQPMGAKQSIVLCIDRSGTMSGKWLAALKKGAEQYIDLTKTGSDYRAAVVSFGDTASTDCSLTTLDSQIAKDSVKSRISTLVASGKSNLSDGLQKALEVLKATTANESSHEIIMLFCGSKSTVGDVPASLITELEKRRVNVYAIAAGYDSDTDVIGKITGGTRGSYNYCSETSEVPKNVSELSGEARSAGVAYKGEESSTAKGLHEVIVDSYTSQADFIYSWESGECEMSLVTPDGTTINSENCSTISGVERIKGESYIIYRVSSPALACGTWKSLVTPSVGNEEAQQGSFEVIAESGDIIFETYCSKESYAYPEIPEIHAYVEVEDPVSGVEMTGVVTRPDKSTVNITLYDDGNQTGHADEAANDGIYSNYFTNLLPGKDGEYVFSITADNKNGMTSPDNEETTGGGGTLVTVKPFVRISDSVATVTGFPSDYQSTAAAENIIAPQSSSGGGCFIATAAYGSPYEYHVKILQDFRDNVLLTNGPGKAFVSLYYKVSPPIAGYISMNEGLKSFVRFTLTPAVFFIMHPFIFIMCMIVVVLCCVAIIRKGYLKMARK